VSDWASEPSYLYIFVGENGEYLWYENKEDAVNDKNSHYCAEPCLDDGYLHCHDE
jgi:hypothetical protein